MKNKITITINVGDKFTSDGHDVATIIVYEDLGYASHSVPYRFKNGGEHQALINATAPLMSTAKFIRWCIKESLKRYKKLAKSYGDNMAMDL